LKNGRFEDIHSFAVLRADHDRAVGTS
jgi:hypothetical protein